MSDLVHELARIGAIQFGQFEVQPGQFQPMAIHLRLLPSYPAVLKTLAEEMAPLVKIEGQTHLLTMPASTPLGVVVSLITGLPLVYPAPDNSQIIEGAYDYNEPTVLLTDVFTNGEAEQAMIKRVKGMGLDVNAVVAVLDLNLKNPPASPLAASWRRIDTLLDELPGLTPAMRNVVKEWLNAHSA
jgi:orotate phosphoribosyltransferase